MLLSLEIPVQAVSNEWCCVYPTAYPCPVGPGPGGLTILSPGCVEGDLQVEGEG